MDTMRRNTQVPERRPVSLQPDTTEPETRASEHVAHPSAPTRRREQAVGDVSFVSKIAEFLKGPKGKITALVVAILAVAAIGFALWNMLSASPMSTVFDSNRYQAIVLTTGQPYFGKVEVTDDYYVLTDVFYLQSTSSDATQTAASSDVQLIKLGSEVHGPTDKMVIPKDQVLYLEDLKDDSQVVTLIKDYNK